MRNQRLTFACVFILLILPVSAAQTSEVKSGDPRIHGERLQPFTNQWKMKVVRPDGTVLEDAGTWTDQLESVRIGGRPCWKRTQSAAFKNRAGEIAATTQTVNVFDAKTFVPISREFERHVRGGDDSTVRIAFDDKSMKIETTAKGKTEIRSVPASEAFDFYGGVYALLWVALPLKQDFAATFPSYTEDEKPEVVQQVTYRVTGRESTEAGSFGKKETWVVESDTSIGYLKYWISEGPPYIIRMDFKDTTGALWTLTMI